MHSRSLLLLKRDYQILQSDQYVGILAQPSSDNFYKWRIIFPALENTIWTGGEYRILVQFPPNYNTFPPEIRFLTIPYHPNIDPITGLVNIPITLPFYWTEHNSIIEIVTSLQQLLSEPYVGDECVLNQEAAACYSETPSTYRQIAQDCVIASIKISAGIAPYIQEETPKTTPIPDPTPSRVPQTSLPNLAPIQHVSYSDYLSIWSDLATTKNTRKQALSPIETHHHMGKQDNTDSSEDTNKENVQLCKETSLKAIASITVDRKVVS